MSKVLFVCNTLLCQVKKVLVFSVPDKELQESMNRCTGQHDITETLLKTVINTIQSINQFSVP